MVLLRAISCSDDRPRCGRPAAKTLHTPRQTTLEMSNRNHRTIVFAHRRWLHILVQILVAGEDSSSIQVHWLLSISLSSSVYPATENTVRAEKEQRTWTKQAHTCMDSRNRIADRTEVCAGLNWFPGQVLCVAAANQFHNYTFNLSFLLCLHLSLALSVGPRTILNPPLNPCRRCWMDAFAIHFCSFPLAFQENLNPILNQVDGRASEQTMNFASFLFYFAWK